MTFEKVMERIEVTRSRIESHLNGPSVINVSSARVEDDSAALAEMLAYSFVRSGHTTIIIEARSVAPTNSLKPNLDFDAFWKSIHPGMQGSPDLLELDGSVPRSAASTRELYARLKSRYAVSISSQTLAEFGGTGLSLAADADAIVIGVRKGRSIGDSDRELKEVLNGCEVPVLGVVLIEREAVKAMKSTPWTPGPIRSLADQDVSVRRKALSVNVG